MMKRLAQLVALLILAAPAWALNDTWYIATTGSNSNAGTSAGAPFATFSYALSKMSGCDTLVIEGGTPLSPAHFYDTILLNSSALAGNVSSSGCYTTFMCTTDFACLIDGSTGSSSLNAIIYDNQPYISFIGIIAESNPTWNAPNGASPWAIYETNHVKLQRTAGFGAPCGAGNGDNWNINVYSIGPGDDHVLVEDSHAWGCGRYKFEVYQSTNTILRRDVSRHDLALNGWESGSLAPMQQCSTFATYDSTNTLFENDIAIDSGDTAQDTGEIYGGVPWSEHNDGGIDNSIEVDGSLVLNVQGLASSLDQKDSGTHVYNNDAFWGNTGGIAIGVLVNADTTPVPTSVTCTTTTCTVTFSPSFVVFDNQLVEFTGLTGGASVLNGTWFNNTSGTGVAATTVTVPYVGTAGGPYSQSGAAMYFVQGTTLPTMTINHVTAGGMTGTASDTSHVWGVGVQGNTAFSYYISEATTNSIFESEHSYGVADYVHSNYNYYYLNGANFGATYYEGYVPTAGANDVQGTNPQLKYLTREEAGSPVYGTASDGGNIGATILYEWGVTGTLYGDTGYDTLTATSLWPFPNEGQIKNDFASFSMTNPYTSTTVNGARGFAASGTGLYGGPITLTSYIWEYLGNACPGTICSGATAGGSAISGAVAGSVIQ